MMVTNIAFSFQRLFQYCVREDNQSVQFVHRPQCFPASQAIPLPSLDMILVAVGDGTIAMYSGMAKVGPGILQCLL